MQKCFFLSVSTPTISVTAPKTQTVSQSLTLQCEVTTERGITSRVDIVWSSDDTVLRNINDTIATTMNNSLVFASSYTISQLSTADDGRVIQCEVVINTSPSVMASNSVTLNVTGEYYVYNYLPTCIDFYSTHSSHSYSHHITIWSHTRSYGG